MRVGKKKRALCMLLLLLFLFIELRWGCGRSFACGYANFTSSVSKAEQRRRFLYAALLWQPRASERLYNWDYGGSKILRWQEQRGRHLQLIGGTVWNINRKSLSSSLKWWRIHIPLADCSHPSIHPRHIIWIFEGKECFFFLFSFCGRRSSSIPRWCYSKADTGGIYCAVPCGKVDD